MRLPVAQGVYSQANEQQARGLIERSDAENHKRGRDVEIGAGRLILSSPDGARWVVEVGTDGSISAAPL